MYGKLKGNKIRKRASYWETGLLVLIGVFAFVLAGNLHDKGVPQKWGAAVLGTLIPFGFVIYAFRERLFRQSFWGAFSFCLLAHLLVLWAFFEYVLSNTERLSVLLWLPVMLVEVFLLLILVKRIEEKLTGERYTIKLKL
jgi:hypothetical protein